MNGLPQHARVITPEPDGVRCACACGNWSVLLPARSGVRDEAAARFRDHMAESFIAPTPDRLPYLAVRPGITIPPLILLARVVTGLAMWVAIGAAVIGVLR